MTGLIKMIELLILQVAFSGLSTDRTALTAELQSGQSKKVEGYVKLKSNGLISTSLFIELLNNKSHGLLPPGGFSSLLFDQVVPYYSQHHLANRNAIYIWDFYTPSR